jgi:hypothetical protein
VHERTSLNGWHKRLGHPSIKIFQHLVNWLSLPVSTKKFPSLCTSCSTNKTHKQPFGSTSFQIHSPLDIIYTDIWGLAHITGISGARYDLFLWIIIPNICGFIQCPQNLRFLASFPNSKCWLKKRFQSTTKALYSDNGGEILSLKTYLSNHGISHYTTAPHTPQ